MTLTKTETAESPFNAFGWHNREARSDVDQSVGWGLLGKRALTHRVSVAVAGVRRFVLTLLSALLVGCGGDGSDSDADTAAPPVSLQEQILVFTQAGPLNLVVGDTLSNVASGGLGTGVISYSSSDATVATVNAAGRLTVVGDGIAMITAEKAADTQYAAASVGYVVSATPVPPDTGPEPQRIGFDQPGPFNLVVGDTLSNVASGGPGTGLVSYSSSNTTVVTVDAEGRMTVVGAGIATITAEKAADTQYAAARASYLVQTTPASQAIGFDQPGPLYLMVGETLRNVASGGSGTGVIRYSSSNTTVATVDAAGELTVVGIGTATITAEKAADAQYTAASASYTVNAPSRVPVTAWVGREDAQVQVDLPLSPSGMQFFRSNEANCDLSNVANCANGQSDIIFTGQTVEDTAFTVDPTLTVNQTAYYTLQYGANQASLEVSAEERLTNANNTDFQPRDSHHVVVHNNRLWVIGGYDGFLPDLRTNDVWWSVDGVNWTEVPINGERFSPRSSHQAVSFKDKLWVFGGAESTPGNPIDTDSLNDIWYSEDDGRTWAQVARSAGPRFPGRSGHQVVVHKSDVSNEDELFLIGGWDSSERKHQNDVWRSADGETWKRVTENVNNTANDTNDLNAQFQVVSYKDRLWIVTAWRNDIWASQEQGDGTMTWTQYRPGNTPNTTHNLALNRRHNIRAVVHDNQLWVVGGVSAGHYKNDVWWSEDGLNWTRVLNPNSTNPNDPNNNPNADEPGFPPREKHGFVSYNNRLWVIGGHIGAAHKNDVWRSEDGVNWRLGFHDVFQFRSE